MLPCSLQNNLSWLPGALHPSPLLFAPLLWPLAASPALRYLCNWGRCGQGLQQLFHHTCVIICNTLRQVLKCRSATVDTSSNIKVYCKSHLLAFNSSSRLLSHNWNFVLWTDFCLVSKSCRLLLQHYWCKQAKHCQLLTCLLTPQNTPIGQFFVT